MWSSSRSLGVGRAIRIAHNEESMAERGHPYSSKIVVVCFYFPPGNVASYFTENVHMPLAEPKFSEPSTPTPSGSRNPSLTNVTWFYLYIKLKHSHSHYGITSTSFTFLRFQFLYPLLQSILAYLSFRLSAGNYLNCTSPKLCHFSSPVSPLLQSLPCIIHTRLFTAQICKLIKLFLINYLQIMHLSLIRNPFCVRWHIGWSMTSTSFYEQLPLSFEQKEVYSKCYSYLLASTFMGSIFRTSLTILLSNMRRW